MSVLATHEEAIKQICEKFHVHRLYAFGSVLREDFKESSDIDFLVAFKPNLTDGSYFTNFFNLKENLKSILGYEVDLVEEHALKNPYVISNISKSKVLIYE